MFLQAKKKDEKKVDLKYNSKNASEKWPFIGHPEYLRLSNFTKKNSNLPLLKIC